MILLAVGCILAVFVGGPLTVLAVLVARMQDPGRHCAAARVPAPRRPVNGRYLGTQPRRTPHPTAADPVTPAQTDDAPPWDVVTTSQPVLDDAPVYGEAPQLVVAAAQHPARRDQPVVPAFYAAAGGTE